MVMVPACDQWGNRRSTIEKGWLGSKDCIVGGGVRVLAFRSVLLTLRREEAAELIQSRLEHHSPRRSVMSTLRVAVQPGLKKSL
jgi:hypothetical protein